MSDTIEKAVPVPPKPRKPLRYPILTTLEVGDSFTVPAEDYFNISNAMSVQKRKTGKKFTMRTNDEGIRVWRTE